MPIRLCKNRTRYISYFHNDCSTNELITVLSVPNNVHYCLKI
nr:MAG TPA: hypothetical protein [Caudoviricetes sp.]